MSGKGLKKQNAVSADLRKGSELLRVQICTVGTSCADLRMPMCVYIYIYCALCQVRDQKSRSDLTSNAFFPT